MTGLRYWTGTKSIKTLFGEEAHSRARVAKQHLLVDAGGTSPLLKLLKKQSADLSPKDD